MLDFLKRLLNNQKPECEPLDPHLVGRIAGPAAFATDDWVVLLECDNVPAKVRRDSSDFPGAVRVILGNPSDGMYAETCYCPSDLGYPLSKDLWSKHQIEWYRKCHEDEYFINSAKSFSAQPQKPKRTNKQFDIIEEYIEKHRHSLISVLLTSLMLVMAVVLWTLMTNPSVVAPYIIKITVIAGLVSFVYVINN
jgi:hypothetical protein